MKTIIILTITHIVAFALGMLAVLKASEGFIIRKRTNTPKQDNKPLVVSGTVPGDTCIAD